MNGIVSCKKVSKTVPIEDQYVYIKGKKSRRNTIGWYICVAWRDGPSTWERLAALKESNPMGVAECAFAQGADLEPAFAWWVHFTLKRRDMIISAHQQHVS